MEKLKGRDLINAYAISRKVNEIIDFLEEVELIEENPKEKLLKNLNQ